MANEWISSNIQERTCNRFCSHQKYEHLCRCLRKHSSDNKSEVWTIEGNTVTRACRHVGEITSREHDQQAQYVRIDVKTPVHTTETLLLDIWGLHKPQWILSVIGDVHEREGRPLPRPAPKERELKLQIKHVVDYFSLEQNVWITSEGINFGVSKMVGTCQRWEKYVTKLGIYGWGSMDNKVIKAFEQNPYTQEFPKSPIFLDENTEGNHPSSLYKHHLLVDDGSRDACFNHTSFQTFRIQLEAHLARHRDVSSSIPLVTVLYGGWSYVLDGVKSAIENNIPVVLLKGTGGFADVLISVFEASREDKTNVAVEKGRTWTGTVLDDGLRSVVEREFTQANGKPYKAGEYLILECLQKRELLTVVDVTDDKQCLARAIIKALLKSKTTSEILRLLDRYMPASLFGGQGAAVAAIEVMTPQIKALNETTALFLVEAMLADQAEIVQFILDYNGVDLRSFLTKTVKASLETTASRQPGSLHFTSGFSECDLAKVEDVADVYRWLMIWAVRSGKQTCAAVFWKKGQDLLSSALLTSQVLSSVQAGEVSAGTQNEWNQQAELFLNRAVGVMDGCYDENEADTMKLLDAQTQKNKWNVSLLNCSFTQANRRIFATQAYKTYIGNIWWGKMCLPEESASLAGCCKIAPVLKYVFNLVSYLCFLGLFAHTLLFSLRKTFLWAEGVLLFWWFTFVIEEIRQINGSENATNSDVKSSGCKRFCWKLDTYFRENYWNILDAICLFLFFLGAVHMTVVHTYHGGTEGVYTAARVFLSLDVMIFTWRFLQYISVHPVVGMVLEMIYQMVQDLLPFLLIMAVFIFSQGLAAHALLYPNRGWSPEAFINIPSSAFWNIFGELGLDAIEASESKDECSSSPAVFENGTADECPSTEGRYVALILLGVYMLLMNVLLLNIVIARFSFTFTNVYEQAWWLAAWQRARMTVEYYRKPPVCPPFNIFFHIAGGIYGCCTRGSRNSVAQQTNTEKPQGGRECYLGRWERSIASYYLATAEAKFDSQRNSDSGSKIQTTQISEDSWNPGDLKRLTEELKKANEAIKRLSAQTTGSHAQSSSEQTRRMDERLGRVESNQEELKRLIVSLASTNIARDPSSQNLLFTDIGGEEDA